MWSPAEVRFVIFMSRELVGFNRADPNGEQLHALQQCLLKTYERGVPSGRVALDRYIGRFFETIRVRGAKWQAALPKMHVWFDYMSIPQLGVGYSIFDTTVHRTDSEIVIALLAEAVAPIPAYVEREQAWRLCWRPLSSTRIGTTAAIPILDSGAVSVVSRLGRAVCQLSALQCWCARKLP